MSVYPIGWDITSRREREDEGLVVDITATGTVRARKRHGRYRFALRHDLITAAEAATLQAWCEAREGLPAQITWRDGTTYEGILTDWSIDIRHGPMSSARAVIRGAAAI